MYQACIIAVHTLYQVVWAAYRDKSSVRIRIIQTQPNVLLWSVCGLILPNLRIQILGCKWLQMTFALHAKSY